MVTKVEDLLKVAKSEDPITTTTLAGGSLLLTGQAEKFIQMTFDAARTTQLCRTVTMGRDKLQLDKISIASRIARKATENEDQSEYTKKVAFGKLTLDTVKIALPWELTEDALEDNIEKDNLEDVVVGLMTTQYGLDLEDLYWNGDDESEDALLSAFDGWLVQFADAQNVDANSTGSFDKTIAFDALRALPARYRKGPAKAQLRWLMPSVQYDNYLEYVTSRLTPAGDAVLVDGQLKSILGIQVEEIAALPDTVVVLTDPKNLVVGVHRAVKIRRTDQGKSAVMTDTRFYCAYTRVDCKIEWPGAVVYVKELSSTYDVTSVATSVTEVSPV